MEYEKSLLATWRLYNSKIKNEFKKYWIKYLLKGKYDDKLFLKIFVAPRETFIMHCDENNLNYSSVAGTILEWTLFNFLQTGIEALGKDSIAETINRHQIPYIWKSHGNSKINIDLVIKNINTKKIYYAFEMKTNFEDGFEKYREEEKMVYHHRKKLFKCFKYFYISLSKPPANIFKKHKRDLRTLERRNELFIMNNDYNKKTGVKCFLKTIVEDLKLIV